MAKKLMWKRENAFRVLAVLTRIVCYAAYMSSPCHIELTLTEKNSDVKNEAVSHSAVLVVSHRVYHSFDSVSSYQSCTCPSILGLVPWA